MSKKKLASALVASMALAMITAVAPTATAALKSANIAVAGDDCVAVGRVAKGRGVEGTDLTCLVVTTGTLKGKTKWWYKDVTPLTKLEWVASSGVGGGYGTTAIAFADAMKAEGMLSDYTVSYKSGGSGTVGLGYFQDQKDRKDVALITGLSMIAGIATTKSKLKHEDSKAISGLMREWEAIVVPSSSKYKTINDLLTDIKANPKLAIAGGSKGTTDHIFMGLLMEKAGIKASDMNYVPYAGGGEVTTAVLGGQFAAGVSGTSEFTSYVKAGKMRVLALSSPTRLKSIKGATLISQGINFSFGNWRGVMGPASLTEAERVNWLKIVDVTRAGDAWKATLVAKDWTNQTDVGKPWETFLAAQKKDVTATLVTLGLA
jgi:putative tricarboxylic transport membrane protein